MSIMGWPFIVIAFKAFSFIYFVAKYENSNTTTPILYDNTTGLVLYTYQHYKASFYPDFCSGMKLREALVQKTPVENK